MSAVTADTQQGYNGASQARNRDTPDACSCRSFRREISRETAIRVQRISFSSAQRPPAENGCNLLSGLPPEPESELRPELYQNFERFDHYQSSPLPFLQF